MDSQARADGRYLPIRYPEEEPYWAAAKLGKLVLPTCHECGHTFHPVGPVCPRCLSTDIGWREMSGRGTISSYVIYHKGWSSWLAARVPYVVAQIELVEGPRLTTGLIDIATGSVAIGTKVRAVFEEVTDDISLIHFAAAS